MPIEENINTIIVQLGELEDALSDTAIPGEAIDILDKLKVTADKLENCIEVDGWVDKGDPEPEAA